MATEATILERCPSSSAQTGIENVCEGTSTGESGHQKSLEVIFDPETSHRRKSSIGFTSGAGGADREGAQQKTACRVHQFLEAEQRREQTSSTRSLEVERDESSGHKPQTAFGGANEDSDGLTRAAVRSRLLTKKQLSEMAWGVRELSKKLGSIHLKLHVRTVFVLTKTHDESLIETTRDLVTWLLSKKRDTLYTVYVEDVLGNEPSFDAKGFVARDPSCETRLKYWTNELCASDPQAFDLVITLGGDGTVLYASWLFQQVVPPVLSFSLGSLGFLTKFDFAEYEQKLSEAFRRGIMSLEDNPYKDLVEQLSGQESENNYTHKPGQTIEILNDIVVDRGPNPTMSTIELFGDDEHFTTVQADGICVATPTGSTAYNLAAGGSLCHPDNPVILVTAICAHTLSFRPVILPDTIVLRIGVPYDARTSSWASFDGRERVELFPGDYVTVSASRFPFAYVMPDDIKGQDWVSSISRTLQWNSRQRQKAFKDW